MHPILVCMYEHARDSEVLTRVYGCPASRVIVTAVDKSSVNLKLRLFNNCFNDEFSTRKYTLISKYQKLSLCKRLVEHFMLYK